MRTQAHSLPRMLPLMLMALMFAMIGATGCSSPQTGVKTSWGKLSAYLDAMPPQVIAAAEQVAEDMELKVESSASTQLDGRLVARTAQDKSIKVNVERYGDNISAITIKVGTWGDEKLSLEYFNAIQAKLAGRSRSASPPSTEELNLLQ